MSVKVANYGVDYLQFAINDSGVIEFTTAGGVVKINGDLQVTGESTSANDLIVSDNIIILNDGEQGAGVTLGTSGISIDRGSETTANFLWDESLQWLNPDTGTTQAGAFKLTDGDGDGSGLFVNTLVTNSTDLYLLGTGTNVVSVTGTTDYEKQIWDYSDNGVNINNDPLSEDLLTLNSDPNKGDVDTLVNVRGLMDYVRDYTTYNFQKQITAPRQNGITKITAQDVTDGDPISSVNVTVNDVLVSNFEESSISFFTTSIQGQTILGTDPAQSLVLTTDGDTVEIQKPTTITRGTSPGTPLDGITLYAGDEADGGTGLYYTNDNGTTDEIISKNKSLLYSILF